MKSISKLSSSFADLLCELASSVRSGDSRNTNELVNKILNYKTFDTSTHNQIQRNIKRLIRISGQTIKNIDSPALVTDQNRKALSLKSGEVYASRLNYLHSVAGDTVDSHGTFKYQKKTNKPSYTRSVRRLKDQSKLFDIIATKMSENSLIRIKANAASHNTTGHASVKVSRKHKKNTPSTADKRTVGCTRSHRATETRHDTSGFKQPSYKYCVSNRLGELVARSGVSSVSNVGSGKPSTRKVSYTMARRAAINSQLKHPINNDKKDGFIYPVWFGTNRNLLEDNSLGSELGSYTIRGRADVYIPKSHRFGEIGNGFWKRILRWELRDDNLEILKLHPMKKTDFYFEILQEMQAAKDNGEKPHALIFLHGYNVSFEDAVIRAAQIGCDLKVSGATALFSWPSLGETSSYLADEDRIMSSELAITDFLVDFCTHCGADKVHIIAHSMGNRGLLRALEKIAANASSKSKVKFGQIFLAAPDVNRDLFSQLASVYTNHAERTTLYASKSDKALGLSKYIHNTPRAGYYKPYTVVPGVDTVTVPNFNVDLLGHSYFAQADALLHDIYDLMRHGEEPSKRQRIEPTTDEGLSFWTLCR